MKTLGGILLLIHFLLFSSWSIAGSGCSSQVDYVRFFYVNGMFTSEEGYFINLDAVSRFQQTKLDNFPIAGEAMGHYNFNEEWYFQLVEVARQKYDDSRIRNENNEIIEAILSGNILEIKNAFIKELRETLISIIPELDYSIVNQYDYLAAKSKLFTALESCNRFVLLGHSQGNFYTNRLFDDVISSYQFSNEYFMRDYPMVVLASVATPASGFGGPNTSTLENLVAHLTLDQDLVMQVVRNIFGSVESNMYFDSLYDKLGHSLVESYLAENAGDQLAIYIYDALRETKPFPIHGQNSVSSSAFDYVGYSLISEILDVQFDSGAVYRYESVPKDVWQSFYSSSSFGAYYNEHIRGQFHSTRLE